MQLLSPKILIKTLALFGVDNSPWSQTDNRKNKFLVSGEEPTDDINSSVGTTKKSLLLNLLKQKQSFA